MLQIVSETMIDYLGPQLALILATAFFLFIGFLLYRMILKTVRVIKIRQERARFYNSLISEVKNKQTNNLKLFDTK
jgi:multisubunit Na+/H+ antiporter MnhE subunit